MILRAIESKTRIASSIIGAAWSIATYFVVPIIVFEGDGAWASIKRSWEVLKGNWGESIVGHLAMGLIFIALGLPVILIFIAAGMNFENLTLFVFLILMAVVYLMFIAILYSTVSTVLQTALYRYVKTGEIGITLPNWLPPPQGTATGGSPPSYPTYDDQPQPPTY
jgi:hypothetical protein